MKMLQISALLLALMLSALPAQAAVARHDIEQIAHQVFVAAPEALDLGAVNELVASEQFDIEMSYERLLQAQKRISEARAQYFPYGLGTVATLYLLNAWNPLLLVELVTSLPSKIYQVQSEKNMRWAQHHAHVALRENIKNQVAALYYTVLKEETGLHLVNAEILLVEELWHVAKERLALGLVTEEEVLKIELRLLSLRDLGLRFESFMVAEKHAFNEMLGKGPEEELLLAPVGPDLNAKPPVLDQKAIVAQALTLSPEIRSAEYMVQAAQRNRASVKWSVLSFSGLGFGYWARVNVAGSKTEEARQKLALVKENIASSAFIAASKYQRAYRHYLNEVTSLTLSEDFVRAQKAQFNTGVIGVDRLIETELLYLRDFSEWAMAHYDALIRRHDLSRVVLGNLDTKQSTLTLP